MKQKSTKIKALGYSVGFENGVFKNLNRFLKYNNYSRYVILCDENTVQYCLPIITYHCEMLQHADIIEIESSESNKTIETASQIWLTLIENNFDKNTLIINLGGGVVSDLGGFVAALYKRGIDFINIPTTLLAMADASVGGKTGIDFGNVKNSLGTITQPKAVFIYTDFLNSLPKSHYQNGLAEVYKMALIKSKELWTNLKTNKLSVEEMILQSVTLKNAIVKKDPFDKGIRKTLNFGHTIGHAIEAHLLGTKHELLHGEAIVIGMIAETWLSHQKKLISKAELEQIVTVLKNTFVPKKIAKARFNQIIELTQNDKKNSQQAITCSLLNKIGDYKINVAISPDDIKKSLEFYNSII